MFFLGVHLLFANIDTILVTLCYKVVYSSSVHTLMLKSVSYTDRTLRIRVVMVTPILNAVLVSDDI